MKTRYWLVLSLLALSGLASGRAEVTGSLSVDIRIGNVPPPPPPAVVVVESAPSGPPPWAAPHWYSRERAYYYYPECDVYYRPADRMWFFLEGGAWQVGARLPDRIDFDPGHGVHLSMASDRPYIYHQHVVMYYPHEYFARARNEGEPKRGPDRSDDDNPGRGHGRGHDKKH